MATFTAYVEYDPVTKSYSAIVPGIPGAHTQGDTLDELRINLQEVLELVLEDYDDELPNFVGTMAIDVPVSEPGEQTANRKLQKNERSAA